jgi:hypothetical protein
MNESDVGHGPLSIFRGRCGDMHKGEVNNIAFVVGAVLASGEIVAVIRFEGVLTVGELLRSPEREGFWARCMDEH